jgi:chaperonin GroES
MSASIKPLGDRVVVKPQEAEETTAGGLYIPDTAKEKPQRGTVVAVGPGKVENGTKIDMTVSEGDTVLYGKYAGTEITLDDADVLIMRESDILGVVND